MTVKTTNQKEASRRKSLGELGELLGIKALVDDGFDRIANLNDSRMNYPFGDLYAEKCGKKFVISLRAFQRDLDKSVSFPSWLPISKRAKVRNSGTPRGL